MRRRIVLLTVAALVASGAPAALIITPSAAQAQVGCRAQTPQPGTQRRVAILNALRPRIEDMAGEDVEFMVDRIRVACNWARVSVRPQTPGGGGNRYETVDALLERSNSTWRVRQIACGEMDCAPASQQFREAYPTLPTALLFNP